MGCSHSSMERDIQKGPHTLYVSASNGPYRTLSDAVAHANAGDRIIVAPGTYLEHNTVVIRKPLDIIASNMFRADNGFAAAAEASSSSSSAAEIQIGDYDYRQSSRRQSASPARHRRSTDVPKILGQRNKLITVDIPPQSTTGRAGVYLRGFQLVSGSDDQPAVSVMFGTLQLESCDISGGQECVAVHGPSSYCDAFGCTMRGSARTAMTYSSGARGTVRNTTMTNNPTGVVISSGADPTFCDCIICECGTGVLVRDAGLGMFSQCSLEKNRKPGVIVSGKSNPMMRNCRIAEGESNGVFVRDEGRGSFVDCDISANGLPAVATCTESYPVLCHCTISDGRNAGILVYDNGAGIISKCIIHDNQMPGIEVRAGGHPVIASCEIFNHKSNGVYVHKRGRGVFHGCRIYENELPGIAIRTGGNPLIHGCSVITGKDSALMVCDKGKGIILESALKGYSTRPLEIRDDCSPFMEFCELHDGKQRHVIEWLEQVPKVVSEEQIRLLGWTDEQLAKEDNEVEATSAALLRGKTFENAQTTSATSNTNQPKEQGAARNNNADLRAKNEADSDSVLTSDYETADEKSNDRDDSSDDESSLSSGPNVSPKQDNKNVKTGHIPRRSFVGKAKITPL